MTYEELRKAQEGIKVADIKGKNYVQVNSRVDVFRRLYPEGTITTDILSNENGVVLMKATVMDAGGHILSTGLAYEKEASSYINKASYIENCETSAVGRALGFLGIGVDASIASVEEMVNAVDSQERIKERERLARAEIEADAKKRAEDTAKRNASIDHLLGLLKDTNNNLRWLLGGFEKNGRKCESLYDLTDKEIEWSIRNLEKMLDTGA